MSYTEVLNSHKNLFSTNSSIKATLNHMKKLLFSLCLLLSTSATLFAQEPPETDSDKDTEPTEKPERVIPKIGKITGIVLDSASGSALEFATISIYTQKDSNLVGGQITDSKGRFEISDLPLGRHRVVINYMGYVTKTMALGIRPQNATKEYGKIYLAPSPTMLDVAEVTAERQVFQMGLDKKVFNVDKTNLGDSENATEVLRNTPTVEVDFDGGVKIRGSAVQVYINGKPTGLTGDSQAEILDQLPANSIKSVELITNPSAKYDPEGEAGIINIVLKKNVLEGFTGSVNASVGTSTWVPFRRYRGGLSLNFRNNKINFFSNFSYNYSENYSRSYLYRSNYLTDTAYHTNQVSERQRNRNGGMARVGFDYYFDDFNTLTVAARVRPGAGGNTGGVQYDYFDQNKDMSSFSQRNTLGDNSRMNMTYNVIYSKIFRQKKEEENDSMSVRRDNSQEANDGERRPHRGGGGGRAAGRSGTMGDKQELVVDLQYTYNNGNNGNEFEEQQYNADGSEMNNMPLLQNTLNGQLMHQGTMMIDYTHPLKKSMKIEAGYKGNIRWLSEDFNSSTYNYAAMQFADDVNLSNEFDYQEQVHAAYGTFTQKIKKFSYKLGLRLEQTLSNSELINTGETFQNNYFSFFPSASGQLEMKNNQSVRIGYSRRINRPSTWQLNPFTKFDDRLNLRYGNPFLQPQYTNSFELSYAKYWKEGHTFMLTGFYRYNTNLMERLTTVDNEGVSRSTFYNFSESHVMGGELVSRVTATKWLTFGVNGSVYHSRQDASNVNDAYVVNAIGGNVNANVNFVFKFGMRISLYAWYSLPTFVQQGFTGGYAWNSVSISQKVLKNKGTITLSVQNPILGGQYSYLSEDVNFYQEGKSQWESPVFELRFSYRFGKVTVKDGRSKNAGRLNGGGESDGESQIGG